MIGHRRQITKIGYMESNQDELWGIPVYIVSHQNRARDFKRVGHGEYPARIGNIKSPMKMFHGRTMGIGQVTSSRWAMVSHQDMVFISLHHDLASLLEYDM